jgi:hypothetical protein
MDTDPETEETEPTTGATPADAGGETPTTDEPVTRVDDTEESSEPSE